MTDIGVIPARARGCTNKPWRRVAAVTGAVLLAIAGCSKINTDLELSSDLSGQRTMVVSVSESDFSSHVSGTAAEASAVIASAMPEALTGTPLTLTDGSYEMTIVLDFSSPSDYLVKAQEVLDAGGVDLEAEITIAVADSPFSQGVVVEENFNSEDLLEWMRQAVVDGGLLSSTDADGMFDLGTTTVTFDGETETTTSSISFDNREKGGMSSVSMTTEYQGEGTWSRTIDFQMDRWVYEEQADTVEQYFGANLPTGATMSNIDESGGPVTWSVDIPVGTPAEITAAMNKLFGTDHSEFSVEEGSPATGIPATAITLVDGVDCSQLCYYPDQSIEDVVTLPDSWSLDESELGAVRVESDGDHQVLFTSANGKPIEFIEYLPLQGIDVELHVSLSGSLDLDVTYSVEAETASVNSELFESVFRGGLTEAEVEVEQGSEVWDYTVRVQAPNAPELNVLLGTYVPGAEVILTETGNAFSKKYAGAVVVPFSTLVGAAEVAEGIDYKVSLPFLHSLNTEKRLQADCSTSAPQADRADVELWCAVATDSEALFESGEGVSGRDSVLVFAASGLSLLSMILIAALLGVLIVGGLVLFLLRHKIAAKRAETKQRKAAAQAALPAIQAPPAQQYTGEMGYETDVSVAERAAPVSETAVTEEYTEFPLAAPAAPQVEVTQEYAEFPLAAPTPEPQDDDQLY